MCEIVCELQFLLWKIKFQENLLVDTKEDPCEI